MHTETLCIFPNEARNRRWLESFEKEGILFAFVPRERNTTFHLRSVLRGYNPLILHSEFVLFDLPSVILKLLCYKNAKVVWHLQSTASMTSKQAVKDLVKIRFLGQQLVDRVVAVGGGVYENAKERGFADGRLALVRNAVDTSRFGRNKEMRQRWRQSLGVPDEKFIFLLLGWDPYRKGVDLFLKAADLTRENHPDVLFLIIGREETRRFVRTCGEWSRLGSALRILEPVEDFVSLLSGVDVLVSPSRSEGLPYTVLEAMAAQRVVISSDIGGAREDYGQSEGVWFFPVEDWRRLSTLMKNARDLSADKRRSLGEANHLYVRGRYSLQEWSQNIVKIYTGLLQEQNTPDFSTANNSV
jgi:glycosyltransferase involved in cell wall biosynthesis